MLHLWVLAVLAACLALASLALLRGAAALLVAAAPAARLEALSLVLAGLAGWAAVLAASRAG